MSRHLKYTKDNVTVIILAGGQGRRMGNKNKGLLTLKSKTNDKTFVSRLLSSLSKQSKTQIISANDDIDVYKIYNKEVVSDADANANDQTKDYQGPLSGIISCKPFIKTPLILTVPCDSPLIPDNLVEKLLNTYNKQDKTKLCVVHDGDRLQNLFMLFDKILLDDMAAYFHQGQRKVRTWIEQQKQLAQFQSVDFSDQAVSFTNVNDRDSFNALLNIEKQQIKNKIQQKRANKTPIIGFAAWSGTGKTTLLEKVIPLLQITGLKIAIIKHAHHDFDIDHVGKDSYRLRKAGAVDTIVASAKRWALIHENESNTDPEPNLSYLLDQINSHSLDLIIVEGFKHEAIPRIELHRAILNKPLLYPNDKEIIAIATDNDDKTAHPITRLDINSPTEIVFFLQENFNLNSNK